MFEKIETQNQAVSEQGVAIAENKGIVKVYVQSQMKDSYLSKLERNLQNEIGSDIILQEITQELNHYIRELENVEAVDLKGKLNLASRESELYEALRLKEKISKLIDKYSLYTSANKYLTFIFAKIIYLFKTYVYPEIYAEKNIFEIRKVVLEQVIIPVSKEIEQGENFFDLTFDDIYGMIYFLAGNCHLWFDKGHVKC